MELGQEPDCARLAAACKALMPRMGGRSDESSLARPPIVYNIWCFISNIVCYCKKKDSSFLYGLLVILFLFGDNPTDDIVNYYIDEMLW